MKARWIACALAATVSAQSLADKSSNTDKARRISQEYLLIDAHIDVPYRLEDDWEDVTVSTRKGDFDYPRAVDGGLNAPFMSIYVPASYEANGGGKALANRLIDSMEALVGRAPEKFAMAYSSADLEKHFDAGKISIAMGMENGTPVEGDLENIEFFHSRGIRYITLTHSQANHISDSSYDLRRPWGGLSPFGKEVVKEMNRVGIMVDISHVSDAAFYQAVEISEVPVIASHSSVRQFTPGFERNMDADMIRALAKNGGVIQINFGSSFIKSESYAWRNRYNAEKDKYIKNTGVDKSHPSVEHFGKTYRKNNPYDFADLDDVLDNIDRVVELVGIDYVGIGSDYDGVGDSLPEGLKDVSTYPNLIEGLLDRGYSEADIVKIMSGNILRVWRAVEAYAAAQNS